MFVLFAAVSMADRTSVLNKRVVVFGRLFLLKSEALRHQLEGLCACAVVFI